MGNQKPQTENRSLTKTQQTALAKRVAATDEKAVAEAIGVSTDTLARLLAGLAVRRATMNVTLQFLEKKEATPE